MSSIRVTCKGCLCLLALLVLTAPAVAADAPRTRVARWKGDAKAAFQIGRASCRERVYHPV